MTAGREGVHPLVGHMFELLPQPDTMWDIDARAQWLQTMAEIMAVVYRGSPRKVTVTAIYGGPPALTPHSSPPRGG